MGKWGYNRNGDLWCTSCGGGAMGIPCTETHTWDDEANWWAPCPAGLCDVDDDPSNPTMECPDCGADNADTYVEGPPMCANCGVTKGICKRHPGAVMTIGDGDYTGPWCKACCPICTPL